MMDDRVRTRLALRRATLPAALVAALLAPPTPVLANHSDGTYVGTSASGGSVTLMVSGNTLNISVNDPCGGSRSGQDTIDPNHTFNFDNGVDFGILGEFHQPNQARGNYQVTMGCPQTMWTAEIPPMIDIADHVSVKEGKNLWALFPITLSHASMNPVLFGVQTMDGSAVEGRDYLGGSGTAMIMPGGTQYMIRIPILEDRKDSKKEKKKESFHVLLSNPQNATIADGDGDGWITNNDLSPQQLDACKCQDFKLLKPKKKPEAFLFEVDAIAEFVNLKVPVRYKIRCTQGPGNCAAWGVLNEKASKVEWDAPVQDLHILPKRLGCHGKCNDLFEEGETQFIYTGRVTTNTSPTMGTFRFVYDFYCDGLTTRLTVEGTVTFPGAPGPDEAVEGTVTIKYKFG